MKKLYVTGFNNYTTHDEARRAFNKCVCPVALELCKDGHAYIAWLTDKPVDKDQVAFIGTQPKFNDVAQQLRQEA